MASRIGKDVAIVIQNPQWKVNGPTLLSELLVEEKNLLHARNIQMFNGILNTIAMRSLQVGDPITLKLLERIGFVSSEPLPENEKDEFEEI